MAKIMKISIIIPVYNVENYIERCLRSVISQRYQGQIECIIVDDKTPDSSIPIIEKIIKSYQGKIDFKLIHHTANLGLSAARNTGLRYATGDYVYFLDSDDEITPDCINILCKPLLNKKYDFVISNYELDKDGLPSYVLPISSREYCHNIQKMFLLHQWPSMAWNKLCNLNFLKKNGLYFQEGLIHEDILWSFYLALYAKSFYVCNETTYVYCYRENSIVNEPGKILKHLESFVLILNKMNLVINKESKSVKTFTYCHMNDVLIYSLKKYTNFEDPLFKEYYMKYKECIKGMKFSTLLFSIRMNVKYPVKLFHLFCPSKIGMLFLKRIK